MDARDVNGVRVGDSDRVSGIRGSNHIRQGSVMSERRKAIGLNVVVMLYQPSAGIRWYFGNTTSPRNSHVATARPCLDWITSLVLTHPNYSLPPPSFISHPRISVARFRQKNLLQTLYSRQENGKRIRLARRWRKM